MDVGLCPGNYFDYPDDEVAIQREYEIGDSLSAPFVDETFPSNARSLYFDPLNPPKGSIPNESIKWYRICEGELLNCDQPVTFNADALSSIIEQGALGNSYFINALRLLSCHSKYIKRLIVSDRFSAQGLFTIKFYKAGRWRYLHVDDCIPCRQSGKANFCRNHNRNETFAMILEKAYAKLHGCFEAIAYGLIEKVLQDLTAGAAVQTVRLEKMLMGSICDDVWDIVERGVSENRLLGCGRFIADAYSENPAKRCGITLGHIYQIVDICITSAEPTEDLDALTVGMVCVRNLQRNVGRFTGRWSFGHKLWLDYKEIAFDMRHRTREIQFKRGLGPNPNEVDETTFGMKGVNKHFPAEVPDVDDEDDEPDTLDTRYIDKQHAIKVVQPVADDLHWIQIEDFVDIFNRIYIATDVSFDKKAATRRYNSKWIPGDYLVGAGGPPIVISKEAVENEETGQVELLRTALINENFTDNPMYPFSVSEPTTMTVSLYQADKRWNVGRLGEDSKEVLMSSFVNRQARLRSCMEYPVGIGFLVLRLNGLKVRVTDFKLRKIVAASENVQFSNVVSSTVRLLPGRYAIVPYTHAVLERSLEYTLHSQFLSNQVEFEAEDLIAQRLVDKDPSVEDDADDDCDDNDLLRVHEGDDEVSIMSYERVLEDGDEDAEEQMRLKVANAMEKVKPPRLLLYQPWEYVEETEELGISQVFNEVGEVVKYMKSLRGEVRKLHGTIRTVTAAGGAGSGLDPALGVERKGLLSTSKRY